ncbi:MAG: bifunctional hydroxymethylpyrimidine kinase/phosphomethylpyrimidine kinase [Thermodesulfobacteriota bacterium]
MNNILTIAGSDSSGGAGIQADIKTIHRMGAHASIAVTAVTAQNSLGVTAIHTVPADIIVKQVEAVVADAFPRAVKIGMLKTADSVSTVAELIERFGLKNVVLDPVIRASTGAWLLEPEALGLFRDELLPRVHALTPNLAEASALTGRPVESRADAEEAARTLKELGPDAVVTGGHLGGRCVDTLCDGEGLHRYSGSRLATVFTHGSGCVFSTALAASLGMGAGFREAVIRARGVTRKALRQGYQLGAGPGVVNPLGTRTEA